MSDRMREASEKLDDLFGSAGYALGRVARGDLHDATITIGRLIGRAFHLGQQYADVDIDEIRELRGEMKESEGG